MEKEIKQAVLRELEHYNDAFEERLSLAIQKGLDSVVHEFQFRLRQVEEDQARILRHLGLE